MRSLSSSYLLGCWLHISQLGLFRGLLNAWFFGCGTVTRLRGSLVLAGQRGHDAGEDKKAACKAEADYTSTQRAAHEGICTLEALFDHFASLSGQV